MRIEKEFTVAAPAERAWAALLDLEDLVACLPGAEMTRRDGEEVYRGGMSVTVNGSRLECQGTVRPIDADEDEREASFLIQGRESSGPAIGHGTLHGSVGSPNGATRVALRADLDLTGQTVEPGTVESAAAELLEQFSSRLEDRIAKRKEEPPSRAEAPRAAPEEEPAAVEAPPPAGLPAPIRRYAPVLGALALLIVLAAALAGRPRRGISVELRYRW